MKITFYLCKELKPKHNKAMGGMEIDCRKFGNYIRNVKDKPEPKIGGVMNTTPNEKKVSQRRKANKAAKKARRR